MKIGSLGSVALLALSAISACGVADDAAPPPIEVHTVPGLPGFIASAVSERPSHGAAERLEAMHDVECRGAGTATFEIATGDETILASVARGVVVADARDHVLAAAPIADCGGSADDMVALAVGDAWIGKPVIAVVATVGGHRATETDVVLFTIEEGRLDRVFAGAIEARDGDQRRRGAVIVTPGAVFHRSPDGVLHVLVFDRGAHRFVEHVDG